MLILIPILITLFAILYCISPLDFIPDWIFGPFSFADDLVVVFIAVGAWLIYFALPVLKLLFYLIIGVALIAGMIYLLMYLYKKSGGKKKKFRLRKK